MIKKSNRDVDLVNAGKTVIYRIMHGNGLITEVGKMISYGRRTLV